MTEVKTFVLMLQRTSGRRGSARCASSVQPGTNQAQLLVAVVASQCFIGRLQPHFAMRFQRRHDHFHAVMGDQPRQINGGTMRQQRFETNTDGTLRVDFSKVALPDLNKLRGLPVSGLVLGGYPLQMLSSSLIGGSQNWVLLASPAFRLAGAVGRSAATGTLSSLKWPAVSVVAKQPSCLITKLFAVMALLLHLSHPRSQLR